jgi:Na+-translocating ferredoxin:NAD+ oxidoreductase RNF subunit RnfB
MARALLEESPRVAVSVAPSFPAVFPGIQSRLLPSALRQLGFKYVCETAEGAKYVTDHSFEKPQKGSVCTACPTVVSYVEKYQPHYLHRLMPVVSPMIAHGRMLKERFSDIPVIFIGPCVAKKQEIMRLEYLDAVDIVLTFDELFEWFESEGIILENCTESCFDQFFQIGDARLFPLQGGMLRTGDIHCDGTQIEIQHVSGPSEVMGLFSGMMNLENKLIEPLFCKSGCIGGPCMGKNTKTESLYFRREKIIEYATEQKNRPTIENKANKIKHRAIFFNEEVIPEEVSDNQIQKILERTGKINSDQQLNCGACGYESCLDNAYAVARGMAELEMCIPYMQQLAVLRNDKIIEVSPNGVVLLDNDLCILKMNPAFMNMFTCNNGILGRKISYLLNAQGFESLQSGASEKFESIQSKYGIKYHEMLLALREERQYVGIYADISKINFDSRQLDAMKMQTLVHAKEFLDQQVRFAQEMAHFLGKSTAQSEEMVNYLKKLYDEQDRTES